MIEQNASDPANEPDKKPTIQLVPGKLHLAIAEAEAVLAADGRYFVSGGAVVRIIERDGPGVGTERVNEQTLRTVLSARIYWQRQAKDGIWSPCDPPPGVVQALLHSQDRHHLRSLSGLARQPFYAPSGRLVAEPGYDCETGIFAVFDASEYRLGEPSRELAEASLAYLNQHLDEFEFESEADRSAAICAMLTAAHRPSLPVAPAFNITATSSGSGKSYLADVIIPLAGPEEPYRVSFPTRAEEAGKLIVSVLMERPAVVLFDDMDTNWKSLGPLNRALTSSTTTERRLGHNETATARTNVLFLGTGNNIEPERDLRRRVVSIRLAPKSENPALRSFKGDPAAEARKHRARMVECALNITAAYRAAGEPQTGVPTIGTYAEWSRFCRHPLVWLGLIDPAQSLIDQVSHDPERQGLADFLEAWHQVFGSRSVTTRQICSMAKQQSGLMEALEELPVFEGREINRGKLGWFISKNRGRRAEGHRIEPGDSSERRSWRVVIG